jgi:hypothetical protein
MGNPIEIGGKKPVAGNKENLGGAGGAGGKSGKMAGALKKATGLD